MCSSLPSPIVPPDSQNLHEWKEKTMRIEATLANLLASTTKTKRLLVLFVLLGLALFFVSSMVAALPAQAGTFITVNTTEDESTADGDCSLREAIIAANTDAPRDACPAGSRSVGLDTIGFDLGSSPTITLGSTLPDITDGLVTDGEAEGADVSVSGNNQVRPFIVIRLLYLQNLTITRGNADNADRFGGSGGAIYIANGQLYLNNVTISESNAQGRGGGIAAPYFGTLRVADSTFSGNHADSHGGAIYYNYVLLEVTTSTFTRTVPTWAALSTAKTRGC
jgi:CSLREA domain-containing protein